MNFNNCEQSDDQIINDEITKIQQKLKKFEEKYGIKITKCDKKNSQFMYSVQINEKK